MRWLYEYRRSSARLAKTVNRDGSRELSLARNSGRNFGLRRTVLGAEIARRLPRQTLLRCSGAGSLQMSRQTPRIRAHSRQPARRIRPRSLRSRSPVSGKLVNSLSSRVAGEQRFDYTDEAGVSIMFRLSRQDSVGRTRARNRKAGLRRFLSERGNKAECRDGRAVIAGN